MESASWSEAAASAAAPPAAVSDAGRTGLRRPPVLPMLNGLAPEPMADGIDWKASKAYSAYMRDQRELEFRKQARKAASRNVARAFRRRATTLPAKSSLEDLSERIPAKRQPVEARAAALRPDGMFGADFRERRVGEDAASPAAEATTLRACMLPQRGAAGDLGAATALHGTPVGAGGRLPAVAVCPTGKAPLGPCSRAPTPWHSFALPQWPRA